MKLQYKPLCWSFFTMKNWKYTLFISLLTLVAQAQTIVSGTVTDDLDVPIPYADIYFEDYREGTESDENGGFFYQSEQTKDTLIVSFVGYEDYKLPLTEKENFNLRIKLLTDNTLKEITIYSGKTSKKNNPALDILRKVWENKKQNGVRRYDQYQYEKYEKIEFAINPADSALINSRMFRGMEFVFDYIDTTSYLGKDNLPVFINEKIVEVYGDNTLSQSKELLKANKNSGFDNNQHIEALLNDLYVDYDIYDNYIKIFRKDFVSPISTTGIHVYNYVLADTIQSDNGQIGYEIYYYPRRKGELTFKGSFVVNENTWAVQKIDMASTEDINVNWVRGIYMEQEFESLNSETLLLTKDVFEADFALRKNEKARGLYGKRATLYNNYLFDIKRPTEFYKSQLNTYNESILNKPDEFWETYRFEPLTEKEMGIYEMLDELQTNQKFQSYTNLVATLGSGYWQIGNFDYGPIFSTFGYNDIEGLRIRTGGRTYFGPNDKWRIEGFGAYGFKDEAFKYGLLGKWMIDTKHRLIISAGIRHDIEQTASTLSPITDVLGRSLASNSLFMSGDNTKLSEIKLTTFAIEIEPIKNLRLSTTFSHKKLSSASPKFNIDFYTDLTQQNIKSELTQSDINIAIDYTPMRETTGYGVDRTLVHERFPRVYLNYTLGVKGMIDSDFDYKKVQLMYRHPILVGGFGWFTPTIELGKVYGEVPLSLLSIIPGNQSYFAAGNGFNLLDYYEFITDEYATLKLEHNFDGRIFSRIPFIRDLNLREVVGIKAAYGTISDKNKALNASNIPYFAPDEKIYYEYYVGIGNIFKFIQLDFNWRGNYMHENARKFGVNMTMGFHF